MKKYFLIIILLITTVLVPPELNCATTKFWKLDTPEEFLRGVFTGSGVEPEGVVTPTMSARKDSLPVKLTWDAVSTDRGVLVGTSSPSRLYWLPASRDSSPVQVKAKRGTGFTSLERLAGKFYAGFTPGGVIFSGSTPDSIKKHSVLESDLIFTMYSDSTEKKLYVGGGDPGGIYEIEPGAEPRVIARFPSQSVLSLTRMGDNLYAGTDRGTLYRVNLAEPDPSPTAIYRYSNREIRSIVSRGGRIYLGINKFAGQSSGNSNSSGIPSEVRDQVEKALRQSAGTAGDRSGGTATAAGTEPPELSGAAIDGADPAGDSPAPATRTEEAAEQLRQALESGEEEPARKIFGDRMGSLLVRFTPPDRMTLLFDSQELIINDLLSTSSGIFVASGGGGRVFRVDDRGERSVFFTTAQNQVMSLRGAGGQVNMITTANAGAVYTRRPFSVGRFRYRSPIFDANLLSAWGEMSAYDSGVVEYRTRSGNTQSPDESWESWSGWSRQNPFEIKSGPARYFQFEAVFGSTSASLRRVEIARRSSNQLPQIVQFDITPHPQRQILFDDSRSRSDAGPKSNGAARATLARLIRASKSENQQEGRVLKWKALDLDGDRLRSELYYRPLGHENWLELAGPEELADKSEYSLASDEFADGRYEFKLSVTDDLSNPLGKSYQVEKVIGPVVVDNSPPRIKDLNFEEGQLGFTAVDRISRIASVFIRRDGNKWRLLRPEDEIMDSRRENFSFFPDLGEYQPGLLDILVVDAFGNRTLRQFELN